MNDQKYLSTDPNAGTPVPTTEVSTGPGNMGAQASSAAALAVRPVANAIVGAATNPNVAKTAATAGRVIGGVAPIVGGAMTGGAAGGPTGAIGGAMVGATQAAKGAWLGGRTGWFTGKLAQQLLMPVAKVAEKIAPFAETFGMLAGASGVYDAIPMRQQFEAKWDAFQKDYPKSIGKERWNALNPAQREEALSVFMRQLREDSNK